MNILLTHPSADLYGSDRMLLLTSRALTFRGHDVTVVLPTYGPLVDRLRDAKVRVIILDTPVLRKADMHMSRIGALVWRVMKSQLRMVRIIRSSGSDVVYINTIVQPWWIMAAKILRRRVVVHVREAESEVGSFVQMAINVPLMFSDSIVCNSEATRRQVTMFRPLRRKSIKVIYNGKDWSHFEGERPYESDRLIVSPRLTVIGRLSPRKGQDVAIGALALLVESGFDATLTLVGDLFPGYGWYEKALKRTAAELAVEDRIRYTGFVDDIRPILSGTDLAIVPSRVEPFGTVAAESMAAGVLTIVADVQGLSEIVEDGLNGLTFPVGDPHTLAERCIWALTHPIAAATLACEGKRDVNRRFTQERYEKDVVAVVEGSARRSKRVVR